MIGLPGSDHPRNKGITATARQSSPDQPHRRSWAAFAAAGYAVFALLLGSNLPTPLFPLYARIYSLSSIDITLLFATYTLAVIPALVFFGPLSDAKGRRELLIPAIAVAALAAGLFAAARSVALLFAAQGVQAMALGALQGTAAPTLVEQDPSQHGRRASATASALTVAGAAAGPLFAGILAQYVALPERLSYLVEIGVLAVAFAVVVAAVPQRRDRQRWRPRRPTVPSEIRRSFVIAAISASVAWAVTGLFLSLIPSFVTTVLKDDNLALAGGVVAIMLGPSAIIQIVGHRLDSLRAQTIGLIVMITGLGVLIAADLIQSLTVLIIAAVLAGLGQGLAFMGSLGDINEIAPKDRRADTVASYYVVVYVATALPAIGVGVLTQAASLSTAVQIFGYLVIALCLAGITALIIEGRLRRTEQVGHVKARPLPRLSLRDGPE